MATLVSVVSRLHKKEIAVFDPTSADFERMVDMITKYDCYGIGPKMIDTIGSLQNFFGDSEEGAEPFKVVFSNNTLMVVFNIVSDLLTQRASDIRMTNARILHKRKTVKDDRTIGQNMRSDVLFKDVASLSEFQLLITMAMYEGDSLVFVEKEVVEEEAAE